MKNGIKLIAMDLDGTLTQHKSPLSEEHREVLSRLAKRYKLLMVGAGACERIFRQMGEFPIDIIGNYGMQYAEYDAQTHSLRTVMDAKAPVDRESIEKRIEALRREFGFTEYSGRSVEYHSSGCVTFPILGTDARLEDKLAFDPTREKRRAIFSKVCAAFPEYTVFVGGSSSFDMAPRPYDKEYALSDYCRKRGIAHSETVYIGDDYGEGGNDSSVYNSDFNYIKIDNYTDFPSLVAHLL